jgi:pimeloyl-ACP methyl ester carboxylesterase
MRARTDADRSALERAVATTRSDPGLRVVSQLWGSFASPEHDLRAAVGEIKSPTLVFWGRRDPVIPIRVGRRVADSIADARLVELDTGHVPQTTAPDAVAAELVPFAEAAFGASRSYADAQAGRSR